MKITINNPRIPETTLDMLPEGTVFVFKSADAGTFGNRPVAPAQIRTPRSWNRLGSDFRRPNDLP